MLLAIASVVSLLSKISVLIRVTLHNILKLKGKVVPVLN
jgi:hypothetical protein